MTESIFRLKHMAIYDHVRALNVLIILAARDIIIMISFFVCAHVQDGSEYLNGRWAYPMEEILKLACNDNFVKPIVFKDALEISIETWDGKNLKIKSKKEK